MPKRWFVAFIYFPITIILLVMNLVFINQLTHKGWANAAESNSASRENQITSGLGTGTVLGANIIPGDARPYLVQAFLARHDSPMTPYAANIVEQADIYNIDFRLVAAIAMCESNAGKRMPKKDSYNAWGIAVYTGQLHGKEFNDWDHAISWVSKYIRERYYDKGWNELTEIGAIWAPPSVENGYSWTTCVQSFMDEIL